MIFNKTLVERFWKKIKKTRYCWEWTDRVNVAGYGQISNKPGGPLLAHRVSYRIEHGELPSAGDLDHLCRNRWCVNPAHLEHVTHKINILRGIAPSAKHAEKTECDYGHPFSLDNTNMTRLGRRVCRICTKRLKKEASARIGVKRAQATHCKKGHEYTAENTIVRSNGWRICITCHSIRGRIGQSEKTHCPKGHEYNAENTYVNPTTGHRLCKACRPKKAPEDRKKGGPKRQTHCFRGHEYIPENTYIVPKTGARKCKTCHKVSMDRINAKRYEK